MGWHGSLMVGGNAGPCFLYWYNPGPAGGCHRNRRSHGYPSAGPYGNGVSTHGRSFADHHRGANADAHGCHCPDGHAGADLYTYSRTHSHADAITHGYAYACSNTDGYTDPNPYSYAHPDTYAATCPGRLRRLRRQLHTQPRQKPLPDAARWGQ